MIGYYVLKDMPDMVKIDYGGGRNYRVSISSAMVI